MPTATSTITTRPDAIPAATPARDPVAEVARRYPSDTPGAQRVLAETAALLLADAGHAVRLGSYGAHTTVEVTVGGGSLVVVPMADLADLDAELAIEDDEDPAIWHLLARAPTGRLLEPDNGNAGCPSVLWAIRAGIDPAAAVSLAAEALADPIVRALLAAAG